MFLSFPLTEIKAVPFLGNFIPAAICDFKYALAKLLSIPITSPVERISGPNKMSVPGNLLKGNTTSFIAKKFILGSRSVFFAIPAIINDAIPGIGLPITLETNGSVLDALGFTSRT